MQRDKDDQGKWSWSQVPCIAAFYPIVLSEIIGSVSGRLIFCTVTYWRWGWAWLSTQASLLCVHQLHVACYSVDDRFACIQAHASFLLRKMLCKLSCPQVSATSVPYTTEHSWWRMIRWIPDTTVEHAQFSLFVVAMAALLLQRGENEHVPLLYLKSNGWCTVMCSLVSVQRSRSTNIMTTVV